MPEDYLIPHTDHNMTFDHAVVARAAAILNVTFTYDSFPVGSMYWFRPAALKSLELFKSSDFDVEQGLADGTLPHAIERLVCTVAKDARYSVSVC
ncbi:Rhamnan synthesis protein F [compost metagenome]